MTENNIEPRIRVVSAMIDLMISDLLTIRSTIALNGNPTDDDTIKQMMAMSDTIYQKRNEIMAANNEVRK